MRRISIPFFFLLLFTACDDDNFKSGSFIWTPDVTVQKGYGEATLLLADPRPYTDYVSVPSNPDYFDVMISDNLDQFSVYEKVGVTTAYVKVDNLIRGNPYYFFVAAQKEGYDPVHSDTVMIIPSAPKTTEPYLPDFDFSVERLSTSYDGSYTSFTYSGHGGFSYRDNASGTINALGAGLEGAYWSGTSSRLVYMNSRREGNTIFPYELILFDVESQGTTILFETPYHSYFVTSPAFTPDGDKIVFLSSENNSEKYIYDLWTIDPETKEKTRVTNFENEGFIINSFDWSGPGDEIYLDGKYKRGNAYARQGIYKYNVQTKELVPLIVEKWAAFLPSRSPDQTKIAFVSTRTGKGELWIYDEVKLTYEQITGDLPYSFDQRYTNLQWLNDDQLLISAFTTQQSIGIKINVK